MDKDILDFLFYQAEVDKENAWRGKIPRTMAQGARIRTLFIVKSAHAAHLRGAVKRIKNPEAAEKKVAEVTKVDESYKKVVDVGKS